MLFWESKLIHKLRGKTYVPFLHFVGDEKTEDGKAFHVMVMDLLGKSLEDLFQECRRKFDLKTCLSIAVQMVSLSLISNLVKLRISEPSHTANSPFYSRRVDLGAGAYLLEPCCRLNRNSNSHNNNNW